jgi:hypothetical protein
VDPTASDVTSAATPLSTFDWARWEDWAQWDANTDLLISPDPLAVDDAASYLGLSPHSAGETAISRGNGESQSLQAFNPQSCADLNVQSPDEFLNLESTGEAQLSQSSSVPSRDSDGGNGRVSPKTSEHWNHTGRFSEAGHDLADRKRKSSVVGYNDNSLIPSSKRLSSSRVAHNIVEKRYRMNLNEKIEALRSVLPTFHGVKNVQSGRKQSEGGNADADDEGQWAGRKVNKAAVLSEAIDYIQQLEERVTKHDNQMTMMKMQLDVFKTLAAAKPSGAESANLQGPARWRGGLANLQSQDQASPTRAGPVPTYDGGRDANAVNCQSTARGGYMSKLMVGSLAGLMLLQGLGDDYQTGNEPGSRGLFSLPLEFIGYLRNSIGAVSPSATSRYGSLLQNFGLLFKVLLFFGAVMYVLHPSLFESTPDAGEKTAPQLAIQSAPPPGSPVEVRRSAWLTAIQTVWVPRQSLLRQLAALFLKMVKLGIRRAVGWRGYALLTGTTEDQEVARVRAWEIALDAQLTGGDADINIRRLLLTMLASKTLPATPYRLMRRALHIHILLWQITNSRLQGQSLCQSLARRFARHQWHKARELQSQGTSQLPHDGSHAAPEIEALPGHLARLLELDIDTVMQSSVVQRACNLAWNRPMDDGACDYFGGMNTIVGDSVIGSPLDAISAWLSCVLLHKTLTNFLVNKTGSSDDIATFGGDLDVALKIAPTGSLVESYGLVARAVLLTSHRGANIAAALKSLPALSTAGSLTPTAATVARTTVSSSSPQPPPSELKLAIHCAIAVALLGRRQCQQQSIAFIRTIRFSAADFGLLGSTAAYTLLDTVFRDKALVDETREAMEAVSGALKLWASGKLGKNDGVSKKAKYEIAMLSVDVLSWLVGLRRKPIHDPGYGSMSEGGSEP